MLGTELLSAIPPSSFLIVCYSCVFEHLCHDGHVEASGQLCKVGSALPTLGEFWGSNLTVRLAYTYC